MNSIMHLQYENNIHQLPLVGQFIFLSTLIVEDDSKVRLLLSNVIQSMGYEAKGFVNAGVYCLRKEAFSLMPERSNFSLEYDCFPQFIKQRFFGFIVDQFWDIGTPERFREAQERFNSL